MIDLSENNGSFWFQDEMGQYLRAVETSKLQARMKPWLLDAYSGATISNRLKGEDHKLEVEDPHFTLLGLTVRSTWISDVDVRNMANGLCQRMSFFIAEPRRDTDVFDHLRFWATEADEVRRDGLAEAWAALAGQSGAYTDILLPAEMLGRLECDWWRGLRKTIGATNLPASFIRRVGHAVMQYLPVLHALLGKAHRPIDLETALLATRYGEWHMVSALSVLQSYHTGTVNSVQLVASRYQHAKEAGAAPTPRDIMRQLSKSQRENLSTPMVKEILIALEKIAPVSGLIDADMAPQERADALVKHRDIEISKQHLNERKRNERRLRDVIKAYRNRASPEQQPSDYVVVNFSNSLTKPAKAA
ncbi:MAG: hypothetical protein Q4G26_09475 [Paracoccus sp. (in: a-proteobacteria)]|nr:hypothetical protein [Paracoccus sp. (in: a-proteobacteria)]